MRSFGKTARGAPAGATYMAGSVFCAEIGEPACRRLAEAAHVETVPADKVLWHDDAPPSAVGIVVSGYLRFQRHSRDGRRQILNLAVPGDLFGQESEGRNGYTLESATEATLCRFDRRVFDRLVTEDGMLRRALYRFNAGHLERLRWLTWTIGAMRPDERIAAFLLSARSYMPYRALPDGTGLISLAVARRDIADLLATSVETICRVFKALERDGLIRLLDPAHILFLDIDALAGRAGLTDGEEPCAPGPVGPKPGLAHGPMTLVNASCAGEPLVSVLPAWRGRRPD
ncbi:Crp/Fnr family transcriptional regulator [Rhodovulum tesquicola]|uniref:Crp/Fnr family transcriptional regulator n=1 Tax=Rhodovulum tesquicola TaxID=540254 RepID=UPI002096B721|nr:Crp/Fnr family transcriptional regulator [Rhodovulum tesquicola]MCO8146038.1 Crp/Fnr family transcriptional regulator [Rhodovulum tesquicola]